ncbi:DUF898 family protein [Xenophilus sp.]|uniref:YjgN family protein n=1 Tax=Xenophilus sp. TaxID=1873499 RepID=UPI0037DDA6DB
MQEDHRTEPGFAPREAPPPPQAGGIESWPLAFTGDGGVYFGVWIVNILLTIVTLGLFTPWARRRTIRYFYGHTLVAGSPLEFTAGIRSMVFGFLLFAAFYIALNVASETGQALLYGVIVAGGVLLAPFLWGSAMRFRLGHTRWRGLRLRFTAGWGEVYRASWPVFAVAAVWLAAGLAMSRMAEDPPAGPAAQQAVSADAAQAPSGDAPSADDEDLDVDEEDEPPPEADTPPLPRPTWAMAGVALAAAVLSLLCFVRLEFNYKRLLIERAGIGGQAGRWKPTFGDFVRIWLTTLGFFLATLLALAVLAAAIAGIAALAHGGLSALGASRGRTTVILLVIVGFVILGFAFFLAASPALAYREARMFQLMWNNIGVSHMARFRTDLRTSAFVWLRIRNILLSMITGGFYRPFARVAEYRMKTESVTLHVRGGLEPLVGALEQEQQRGGFGDAVADALGLDMIG